MKASLFLTIFSTILNSMSQFMAFTKTSLVMAFQSNIEIVFLVIHQNSWYPYHCFPPQIYSQQKLFHILTVFWRKTDSTLRFSASLEKLFYYFVLYCSCVQNYHLGIYIPISHRLRKEDKQGDKGVYLYFYDRKFWFSQCIKEGEYEMYQSLFCSRCERDTNILIALTLTLCQQIFTKS